MIKLPERSAELIELETRYAQLRQDRQAVESELRQLEEERWQEQNRDDDARDVIAERIALGEVKATAQGVVPEQIEILHSRHDLIQRAERKVAVRVAEQSERHNRSIAAAFRPEHKQAARRIARALRELVNANDAEQTVRGRAPGGTLPAMNFPGVGSLGAAGGSAKFWMTWAERHGYLDEDEARFPAAAF